MGLKNTAKKITKRTGRAFGLSEIIDEVSAMQRTLTKLSEDNKTLTRQINDLEETVTKQNQWIIDALKATNDITKTPPVNGWLRLMQLGNIKLLTILRDICNKHGLTYFLDFGTLLGAVRHKDFIPWDDDIDIALPREDFNKLEQIFKKELVDTDYFYKHGEILRLFYAGTPLQIDIFPVDFYQKNIQEYNKKQELSKLIRDTNWEIVCDWTRKVDEESVVVDMSYAEIEQLRRDKITKDITQKEAAANKLSVIRGVEAPGQIGVCVFDYDCIFPLKTVEMAGEKFAAPNRVDEFLTDIYGDYLSWPNDIYPKHPGIRSRKNVSTIKKIKHFINEDK